MIYDRDTQPAVLSAALAHARRQLAYYTTRVANLTEIDRPRWQEMMRASRAAAAAQVAELERLERNMWAW